MLKCEGALDPINVETNIIVKIPPNMELKLILNEGVEEPIHLLAIAQKVSAEVKLMF